MRREFRVDGRTWVVRAKSDRRGAEQPPEFTDEPSALDLLRRASHVPANRDVIRAALAEAVPQRGIALADHGRLLRAAAGAVESGALVLAPLFRREFVEKAPEDAESKAVVEERKETGLSWIGIELVGEDGNPIPDEEYEIELPDGTVRKGRLDAEGKAQERGIDDGQCKIRFPNLDKDAWEFLESRS